MAAPRVTVDATRRLAAAVVAHTVRSDRRRMARLTAVLVLVILSALYPTWPMFAAGVLAIAYMAFRNMQEAKANAAAVTLLLAASDTFEGQDNE